MILRVWFLCALLSAILSIAVPARAERVIAIQEVTNRVKVRHRPSIDSPAIGSLRYNESAELLESLPYWYHITLDNGVPGYVSRAWTRKLSEAEGDGQVIRIGYWNVGSLTDCTVLAQVVEANFDVLAIAGASAEGKPGYEALLKVLGPRWAGLTAPAAPDVAAGSVFYAIVYRTGIVRPCAEWNALVQYESEGFADLPAYACFEAPMNKASRGIDFMLGIYAAPADADIAEVREEADRLDEVLAAMQSARTGERDIILVGTFNLSAPDLQDLVEARVRTRGAGSVLGANGEGTGALHDHMLIMDEDATIEMIDVPQVIDVRGAAGSHQQFRQSCGNHLPLLLRLRTTGPDDDA
ncbi:MAG: hypothetical protein Kow0099_15970 [Candidatus Abyssubacteria bacterium]